jgi:hypothetical protein
MIPSSDFPMMASSVDSTMAASHAAISLVFIAFSIEV